MSSRLDQMETRRRLEAIERHVDEQVTGISRSIQALENGNATMAMVSALTLRVEAMESRLKSGIGPKPPKAQDQTIRSARPVVCGPSAEIRTDAGTLAAPTGYHLFRCLRCSAETSTKWGMLNGTEYYSAPVCWNSECDDMNSMSMVGLT